jgi:hypothetical protein
MAALLDLARRHWPLAIVITVFALFSVVQSAVYAPTLERYRVATRQAIELGMPLDPVAESPQMPAAVAALLADNSLNAALAEEQGNSGTLTAGLLDDATRLAARNGLTVVSTEQGLVTQLPGCVEVRAHLRLHGSYDSFVRFLGAAADSRSLLSVDRFSIASAGAGPAEIETWVTQLVLKRRAVAR